MGTRQVGSAVAERRHSHSKIWRGLAWIDCCSVRVRFKYVVEDFHEISTWQTTCFIMTELPSHPFPPRVICKMESQRSICVLLLFPYDLSNCRRAPSLLIMRMHVKVQALISYLSRQKTSKTRKLLFLHAAECSETQNSEQLISCAELV